GERGGERLAPAPASRSSQFAYGASRDGVAREPALQVVGKGMGGRITALRFLLEALLTDGFEIVGSAGVESRRQPAQQRIRLVRQHALHRLHHALPLDRPPAGQALEENDAERV